MSTAFILAGPSEFVSPTPMFQQAWQASFVKPCRPVVRRVSPPKGVYVGSLIHLPHLNRAYRRVGPNSSAARSASEATQSSRLRMSRYSPVGLHEKSASLVLGLYICFHFQVLDLSDVLSGLAPFCSSPWLNLSRFYLISRLLELASSPFQALAGWSGGFGSDAELPNEGLPWAWS